MGMSRKKQLENLEKLKKKLNPDEKYTKITKYTLCDPSTIHAAKKLFTTLRTSYSARVLIGNDWMYFRTISKKNIETFETNGYRIEVVPHHGHDAICELEGIPMVVSCAIGTNYNSGVIVKIAYRGDDEEEVDDVVSIVEPIFKGILQKHGVPLDKVCISEDFKCEYAWDQNKQSDFAVCGYMTSDRVKGVTA